MQILLSILILALCFFALSVKIWLKKDGEFSHRCASSIDLDASGLKASSLEASNSICAHCQIPKGGKHQDCPNYSLHHPSTQPQHSPRRLSSQLSLQLTPHPQTSSQQASSLAHPKIETNEER